MRKFEMKAYTDALIKVREILTDEQARQVVALFPVYKDEVDYTIGTRVQLDGVLYRVKEEELEAI